MLRISNYHIYFIPQDGKHGGWGFNVDVSKEWCEFARKQKIDKENYEQFAFDMIRECGFKSVTRDNPDLKPRICEWDEGLLRFIRVPGGVSAASSLVLSLNLIDYPKYVSHNIDTMSQATALLSIITRYIVQIEYSIPNKKIKKKY